MTNFYTPAMKTMVTACGGVLIVLALAGCTTAEEGRYGDRHGCSGSRHYGGCMHMQQHRRDHDQLVNMEKARINSEQARENLKMLREIRRKRGEY